MFGLKHARGTSESDDDDDDMDDTVDETGNDRNPVMIMLRPVSRIIGFDK
jgi:large subunit ribosomal protein L17e